MVQLDLEKKCVGLDIDEQDMVIAGGILENNLAVLAINMLRDTPEFRSKTREAHIQDEDLLWIGSDCSPVRTKVIPLITLLDTIHVSLRAYDAALHRNYLAACPNSHLGQDRYRKAGQDSEKAHRAMRNIALLTNVMIYGPPRRWPFV